ncbi:hypothetical protein AAG906_038786 [Vitis piasezkii]
MLMLVLETVFQNFKFAHVISSSKLQQAQTSQASDERSNSDPYSRQRDQMIHRTRMVQEKPITAKVDVYTWGYVTGDHQLDKSVKNDDEARNDMGMLKRLVMSAIWCIQEDLL